MARSFGVTFTAYDEEEPGRKWLENFNGCRERWAAWATAHQNGDRPSHEACRRAIGEHMPEFLDSHDRRVALCGGDPVIGQHISYWGGPPLISGCSVLALPGPPVTLLRSYDFTEQFFDALIARTRWTGKRILAMREGAGGCLDGVNEDGLTAALTFGGDFAHAVGFAIPMLVRYVLETCSDVEQAIAALARLPSAGVQNIILQDHSGASAVVYLHPDRPAITVREAMVTNHQEIVPAETGDQTGSGPRKTYLSQLSGQSSDAVAQAFMAPPLHHTDFSGWFGTLYTARYEPETGTGRYLWKNAVWEQSVASFEEGQRIIQFVEEGQP